MPIMRSLWLLLLFLLQNHLQWTLCAKEENSRTADELLEATETPDERAQRTIEKSPVDTSRYVGRSFNSRLLRRGQNFHDFPLKLPRYENNAGFAPSQLTSQLMDYDKSFQNDYELKDEDYQMPRPRKRRPPQHNEYPYGKQQMKSPQLKYMSEKSELKALLKMQQYEGLSLSEILQQRNLSLSDLLKGKTEVISALRDPVVNSEDEKNIITTTTTTTTTDLTSPQSVTSLKMREAPDAVHNYSVKIVEIPPEHSTTPDTSTDDDEIMEFSDFKRRINENPLVAANNMKKFHRDMESILNIKNIQSVFTTTEMNSEIYDQTTLNDQQVDLLPNNSENGAKSGDFINYDDLDFEYQNEEPTNTNDFNGEIGHFEDQNGESLAETTTQEVSTMNHKLPRPNPMIYEEILSEIEPEARAEILELLNSSATAEKLEYLLRSRNMSLDELIALRQRGNSRLHLAHVKSTKLQNKLKKDEAFLNNNMKAENSEKSNINSETLSISDDSSETTRSEDKGPISIDLSPNKFIKDEENNEKQSNIKDSVELIDLLSAFDSLPFAILKKSENSPEIIKSAEKTIDNYHELIFRSTTPTTSTTIPSNQEIIDEIERRIDETNRKNDEILGETSTKQSYSTTLFKVAKNNDEEDPRTLSKVKSNIIASGVILGVTILGFLMILIILKIRQKQRYTYSNSFPKTVFQVPAMNTRKLSSSSSNTIMVNVVATSTIKKPNNPEVDETINDIYEYKSDIENDSLDANDSWDTIPDFMK